LLQLLVPVDGVRVHVSHAPLHAPLVPVSGAVIRVPHAPLHALLVLVATVGGAAHPGRLVCDVVVPRAGRLACVAHRGGVAAK
jgi:hypothetical protein